MKLSFVRSLAALAVVAVPLGGIAALPALAQTQAPPPAKRRPRTWWWPLSTARR